MAEPGMVLEYKCPCCSAGLVFGDESQKLKCDYCDNEFDFDTVRTYNESLNQAHSEAFEWEESEDRQWSEDDCQTVRSYICQSCAGELLTDDHTAATFCPYCGNPTILPARLSGGLKPDGVIPFKTSKEDAKAAFLNLCKGKPLLPRFFTQEQQVEKITGMYIPFWLYDCSGTFRGNYKATRVRHWSDSRYNYTKTDHYQLIRTAHADFHCIPMDASTKMDNTVMESIEPFDYSQMVDFETAYLSGYLADKYDVESKDGQSRIRERVDASMNAKIQESLMGFTTAIPTSRNLDLRHSKAKYVLLPVWMLHTKYQDKTYIFAMNAQTGKMTGSLPICPKRSAGWFAGIFTGVALLTTLAQWIL